MGECGRQLTIGNKNIPFCHQIPILGDNQKHRRYLRLINDFSDFYIIREPSLIVCLTNTYI